MKRRVSMTSTSGGRTAPRDHAALIAAWMREGVSVDLMRTKLQQIPADVVDGMRDVLVSRGYGAAL